MTPLARLPALGESIFLFFRHAQIFSTISTAFLNPSHGETQSAARSAFLGERRRDSSGVSLLFLLRWAGERTAEAKQRGADRRLSRSEAPLVARG